MNSAREYLGLPIRERRILAVAVLAGALILALDLLATGVRLWYVLAEVVSMIAYGIVLPVDKQLAPWLAIHHIPEAFMLLFMGYIISMYAILSSLWVLALVPLSYPMFLALLWVTTRVYATQPLVETAKDTVWFWLILVVGTAIGWVLH